MPRASKGPAAGLIIALIVGIVVAAVVILSASVGFWIGTELMVAIGFSSQGTPTLLVGVLFASEVRESQGWSAPL